MQSEVYTTLETRSEDLRRVIAAKMRGLDDEAVNEVFCWTVEKALRLQGKFDAKRASCWTWLCMIAYGQVARYYRDLNTVKVHPESLTDVMANGQEPGVSYEDALITAIDLKRAGCVSGEK